jgi:hypothetical protein
MRRGSNASQTLALLENLHVLTTGQTGDGGGAIDNPNHIRVSHAWALPETIPGRFIVPELTVGRQATWERELWSGSSILCYSFALSILLCNAL